MLNTDLRVTPVDSSHARVNWTTPWPDGASWVFLNGLAVAGPHVTGLAARTMRLLMGAVAAAVEVHDFEEADITIPPIGIPPNTRPTLIWRDVVEAVRFRVYHRERGGAESLVSDIVRTPGQERHRLISPVVLSGIGGRWHLFRVEAVDFYGNESTMESWAYYVTEPASPPGVTVAEGSGAGLYTITVTP